MSDLVWVAESGFDVLGRQIVVRSQDVTIVEVVDDLLRSFQTPPRRRVRPSLTLSIVVADHPANGLSVYRDCVRIASADDSAVISSLVLAEVNRLAVEGYMAFAAHSGAVARSGHVVALPASTGGGKSTLTTACVMEGFEYVSDEALCVDLHTAEVDVYPKPIGLSPASRALLGLAPPGEPWVERAESYLRPEQIGSIASGSLRVRDVVLAEYGSATLELIPIPASEVIGSLLSLSFNNYKHPESSFRLVTRIAREARGWRLRYGDPREASQMLSERLGPGIESE